MLNADGLLVLQAANCNHQIPAKIYEYLRAGRPILALTDLAGDTAGALQRLGIDTIAALDSTPQIAQALLRFIALVREGRVTVGAAASIRANINRAYAAVREPNGYNPPAFRSALGEAARAIGALR